MKTLARKIIIAVALLSSLALVVVNTSHIGLVFEAKSRYSYLYKAGEQGEEGVLAHIEGAKEYGIFVAIQLIAAVMVFTSVCTILIFRWLSKRKSHG